MHGDMIDRLKRFLTRKRLAKLGWYGALAALLVILGTASYAYRRGRMQRFDLSGQGQEADRQPVAVMAAGTPEPVSALFILPTPSPEPTPEPMTFVWPLEGEIIGEYAPDSLIWSETLNQWQNHPGIDISAEAGEAVTACADGTVRDAWEDPLWGCVIELEHREGYVSTYANLSGLNLVKPGDDVTAGQIIGAVGDTADCESELPWHLHFELKCFDEPVNCQGILK